MKRGGGGLAHGEIMRLFGKRSRKKLCVAFGDRRGTSKSDITCYEVKKKTEMF